MLELTIILSFRAVCILCVSILRIANISLRLIFSKNNENLLKI